MKYTILFFMFFFGFISCSSNLSNGKLTVQVLNGYGENADVTFWVEDILTKELKIPVDVLTVIAKTACRYSDWKIEDKKFFYIDNKRINMITFNEDKKQIKVWTHVVQTDYNGTQTYITNSIDFDLNGNILITEDGDISIYSYEY